MLVKLAVRNVLKNLNFYALYLFTLVIGMGVFYLFSAITAQEKVMQIDSVTQEMFIILDESISIASVFTMTVFLFLILYINICFLKDRKKEFAIYLHCGITPGKLVNLIVSETSLICGLGFLGGIGLGIIASQFMSAFTANVFNTELTCIAFVFSISALEKSLIFLCLVVTATFLFTTIYIRRKTLQSLVEDSALSNRWILPSNRYAVIMFIGSIILQIVVQCILINIACSDNFRTSAVAIIIIFLAIMFFYISFIPALCCMLNRNNMVKSHFFLLRQLRNQIARNFFALSMATIFFIVAFFAIYNGYATVSGNIKGVSTATRAIATILSLYLGVVLLLAGSVVVAVQQFMYISDYKMQYSLLLKIGTTEKALYKILLLQMGIYFAIPMVLAMGNLIAIINILQLFPSFHGTKPTMQYFLLITLFALVIYGIYFILTHRICKKLICEQRE